MQPERASTSRTRSNAKRQSLSLWATIVGQTVPLCALSCWTKPAALEVDAGCNVGNEHVGRELGAQIVRLSLQVAALCGRRDSGVDDLFLFDDFTLSASAHELVHIGCVVEMLPADSSNGSNLSVISPASEGVGAYAIRASNHQAGYVFGFVKPGVWVHDKTSKCRVCQKPAG